ncbi:MAG: alkaline phosphatase D family protein [Pseudomonadota bacterium]
MRPILSLLAFIVFVAACETAPAPAEPRAVPKVNVQEPSGETALTRILFGSCLKQEDPMPILSTMIERAPDLTVLLGDNVYGDVEDPSDPAANELRDAYQALAERPEFQRLVASSPLLTTWDDHDYGLNDAGGELPIKASTEHIFEEFWNLGPDDERRNRPGIYTAKTYGPAGQRVQIILLDTRFFRSALTRKPEGDTRPGRYLPSEDANQTMLGAEQEAWLAEALSEPADLRILVSSIQVIADGHGWEAWRTTPDARSRLYETIMSSGADNLVVVSGDRHLAGIYQEPIGLAAPLSELTTSSLNAPQSAWRRERGDTSIEPGPKRLGTPYFEANFGEILVDWENETLTMSVISEAGEPVRELQVPFGEQN